MNKYDELLEELIDLILEFDDVILVNRYDLTKLKENLKKAENEA